MPKDFVISDLHLGHFRIIDFERTEFKTIQEHDEFIIKKWNSTINPEDTVFVLGDVSLCLPKADVSSRIHQLKGHKILVYGNHDHGTRTYYMDVGFEQAVRGPVFVENGKVILSHEPAREAFGSDYSINIYGHLHNSKLNLKNFYSVSAKLIDYTPVPILNILEKHEADYGPLKDREESFTDEWYADYVEQISGPWKGKTPEEVRQDYRKQKHDRQVAYEESKKNGGSGEENE